MRKIAALSALGLLVLPLANCETQDRTAGKVHHSVLAGSWYLKDPDALRNRLGLYLERAGEIRLKARPLAVISPHAGYRYSGQAAAYGYKALRGRDIRRVIVLALSHGYPFHGASVPDFAYYETPLGKVPVDQAAGAELRKNGLFGIHAGAHRSEHSLEMQLPFLQEVLPEGFRLVPVVFGSLKGGEFAEAAAQLKKLVDEKTLVVASSDFTHYGRRFGYLPFKDGIARNIESLDMRAAGFILKGDSEGFLRFHEKTGATICGRVPIGVLLRMLPKDSKGTLLRYYRSGELSGEWDGSVSYASILFTEGGVKDPVSIEGSEKQLREAAMLGPEEQKTSIELARATVEAYVREGKAPDLGDVSKKAAAGLKKDRGVFVTLREHGRLRGCIGSIVGTEPLYKGIVHNAVSASSRDPRFPPVQPSELGALELEVSVLSPMRRVPGPDRILPCWHGVVLRKGMHQAVYLPQVAVETGWETAEMLSHLSRKAGLSSDAWKKDADFYVFEAQIIPE